MPLEALLEEIARWQAAGLRVGVVTGAFDLIHAGHARAISGLRSRVDRIAVGVESDALAALDLGPGCPVSRAEDRARIVAALREVAAVAILEDPSSRDRLRGTPGAQVVVLELDRLRWRRLRGTRR